MKILLDHCVPSDLKVAIQGHEVSTTVDLGWDELANGRLLREAGMRFDVFISVDRGLKHQQNLKYLPIAVLILLVPTSRPADVLPCVPAIQLALTRLEPRKLIEIAPIDQG